MKKKFMYALLCAALAAPIYGCGEDDPAEPSNKQPNVSVDPADKDTNKNPEENKTPDNNEGNKTPENNEGNEGNEGNKVSENNEDNPAPKKYTISIVVEENIDKIIFDKTKTQAVEDEELTIAYQIDADYAIESVMNGKIDAETNSIKVTCYGYDMDVKVVVKNRIHKASVYVNFNNNNEFVEDITFKTGEEFTCVLSEKYRNYRLSHQNCEPYFKEAETGDYSVTYLAQKFEDCKVTFFVKPYVVETIIYDENNKRMATIDNNIAGLNIEYEVNLSHLNGYEIKSIDCPATVEKSADGLVVKYSVKEGASSTSTIKVYLQKETFKYPINKSTQESLVGKYFVGINLGYEFTTDKDGKIVMNTYIKKDSQLSLISTYYFKAYNGNNIFTEDGHELTVVVSGTNLEVKDYDSLSFSSDWISEVSSLEAMENRMR